MGILYEYYIEIRIYMHAVWQNVYKQWTAPTLTSSEKNEARAEHGKGIDSLAMTSRNFHPIPPLLKRVSYSLMTNAQGKALQSAQQKRLTSVDDRIHSFHFILQKIFSLVSSLILIAIIEFPRSAE